ncbi:hypothetical protein PT974_02796 [Cladobotryum mycophilum]|uniref:Vps72/YL1 N-terminal domain-containing protein n=1 Tax=Cladobotryum mycophilum TaxID=491253 RepID=A0ABR0SZ25_9HYPO
MDLESRQSEMDESQLSNPPPSDFDSSDSESEVEQTQGQEQGQEQQQKQGQQVEWLATSRARRSTAGNRMKSMLANEDPDDDLELLFAEDENDQGFSGAEDDASDVHMDSSSDEKDDTNAADDLEGEKELERLAMEKRAAQRKRKAQEAIPAKFRKKVRIDTTASDTSTPTPAPAPVPRPKKKSERTSWLPSLADLPTRASSRKTTRMSKEQLHQQMVEREEKRLKQLAQMQKKAAKMEALKKPPMTQEDRLREAAIVEKRNSKSLNRWEVAEKQREEERRAKLAALHQRTLKGPVITFWSGIGEARRVVVEEEKPKKRRVDKGAKENDKAKSKAIGKDKEYDKETAGNISGQKDDDASQQEQQPLTTPSAPGSIDVKPSQLNSTQAHPNATASPVAPESSQDKESMAAVKENPEKKSATESTPIPPPRLSVPSLDATTSSIGAVLTPNLAPVTRPDADDRPRLMAMPPLPPPPSSSCGGLAAPLSAPFNHLPWPHLLGSTVPVQ